MGNSMMILQVLLMVAVFYFLIIAPQRKRAKQEKTFEESIKVGDKVITKAGIHGKITELTTDTMVLETMAGKIKMEKSAISLELSQKLKNA